MQAATKCTKIYNAHVQPLFYSLNLLFGGVLVAVAVLNSLLMLSNINFKLVVHVLQTTQNLVLSRCCFADWDGTEVYQPLILLSNVRVAVVVFLNSLAYSSE